MKKMFFTAVLICAMTFSSVCAAYAGPTVTAGTRQVKADNIIIKESAPGAIKEDKNIYLRCQYVSFEDGIEYNVLSGDGKIDSVTSENGIIKVSIKSESSKEPMVIELSNIKMYLNGSLAEGAYPLELITEESDEYPDNAFGQSYNSDDSNFNTKYIVFDDEFFTVEGSTNMENSSDYAKSQLPEVVVDTKDGNDNGSYINDENHVMLPVRFIAEALNGSAIVSWDDATKKVTILMGERYMSFTVGKDTMNINGTEVPLNTPMEIKDDRAFLSLRDLGCALGISDDKIYWDDETKTAYLNYKGE